MKPSQITPRVNTTGSCTGKEEETEGEGVGTSAYHGNVDDDSKGSSVIVANPYKTVTATTTTTMTSGDGTSDPVTSDSQTLHRDVNMDVGVSVGVDVDVDADVDALEPMFPRDPFSSTNPGGGSPTTSTFPSLLPLLPHPNQNDGDDNDDGDGDGGDDQGIHGSNYEATNATRTAPTEFFVAVSASRDEQQQSDSDLLPIMISEGLEAGVTEMTTTTTTTEAAARRNHNNVNNNNNNNADLTLLPSPTSTLTSTSTMKRKTRSKGAPGKFADALWDVKYAMLVEYHREHGDCNVPQSQGPLGKWVNKQREHWSHATQRGEVTPLTPRRQQLLEALDFEFTYGRRGARNLGGSNRSGSGGDDSGCGHRHCVPVVPPHSAFAEALWEAKYKELVEFHRVLGHCDVPQNYEANRPLGKWVHKQREHYRAAQRLRESWSSIPNNQNDDDDDDDTTNENSSAKNNKKPSVTPLTDARMEKLRALNFRFWIGRGRNRNRRRHTAAPLPATASAVSRSENGGGGSRSRSGSMGKCSDCVNDADHGVNGRDGRMDGGDSADGTDYGGDNVVSANTSAGNDDGNDNGNDNGDGDGTESHSLPPKEDVKERPKETTMESSEPTEETTFEPVFHDVRESDTTPRDPPLRLAVKDTDHYHDNEPMSLSSFTYDNVAVAIAVANEDTDAGMDDDDSDSLWSARFQALAAYKETHGHLNVDVRSENDKVLCDWIRDQRRHFRDYMEGRTVQATPSTPTPTTTTKSTLNDHRISQLEALGFDWLYDPWKRHTENGNGSDRWVDERKSNTSLVDVVVLDPPVESLSKIRRRAMKTRITNKKLVEEFERKKREGTSSTFLDFVATAETTTDSNNSKDHAVTTTTTATTTSTSTSTTTTVVTDVDGNDKQESSEDLVTENTKDAGGNSDKGSPGESNPLPPPTTISPSLASLETTTTPPPPTTTTTTTTPSPMTTASASTSARTPSPSPSTTKDNSTVLVDGSCSTNDPSEMLLQNLLASLPPEILEEHERTTTKRNFGYMQTWYTNFRQLLSFRETYGHCRVPSRFVLNKKLGSWVKLQREDYKHLQQQKASPMCPLREALLKKVGFDFRVAPVSAGTLTWEKRFQALCDYKRRHGHVDVPQSFLMDEDSDGQGTYKHNHHKHENSYGDKENNEECSLLSLGKWVSKQREFYRAYQKNETTRIDAEKIRLLESVGFSFEVGRGRRRRGRGRPIPPLNSACADGDGNGDQRNNNGTFATATATTTVSLPTNDWEAYYQRLIRFQAKRGHANVPLRLRPDEDHGLCVWAQRQRHRYRCFFTATADSSETASSNQPRSRSRPRPPTKTERQRIQKLLDLGFRFHTGVPEEWTVFMENYIQKKQLLVLFGGVGADPVGVGVKRKPKDTNTNGEATKRTRETPGHQNDQNGKDDESVRVDETLAQGNSSDDDDDNDNESVINVNSETSVSAPATQKKKRGRPKTNAEDKEDSCLCSPRQSRKGASLAPDANGNPTTTTTTILPTRKRGRRKKNYALPAWASFTTENTTTSASAPVTIPLPTATATYTPTSTPTVTDATTVTTQGSSVILAAATTQDNVVEGGVCDGDLNFDDPDHPSSHKKHDKEEQEQEQHTPKPDDDGVGHVGVEPQGQPVFAATPAGEVDKDIVNGNYAYNSIHV